MKNRLRTLWDKLVEKPTPSGFADKGMLYKSVLEKKPHAICEADDTQRSHIVLFLIKGKAPKLDPEGTKKVLQNIGQHWPLNPEYVAHQKQLEDKLVNLLCADEAVREARLHWAEWKPEHQMKVLQRIHEMHAGVYGFPSCRLEWKKTEPRKGILIAGGYDDNEALITLNTHRAAANREEFYSALSVLAHENTHRHQFTLAAQAKAHKPAGKNCIEHDQAQIFVWTTDRLYTPLEEDEAGYHKTQIEVDAYAQGCSIATRICPPASWNSKYFA